MKSKVTLVKEFTIGQVDKNLFSSFIEHLGRAVYDGIYEPGHPLADEQGFRKDVIQLVKDLRVSLVRYPGGNFLSGYNWKDGIGPKEARPVRLDRAWRSIEPNQIGIDEFYDWTQKAGCQLMGAVNMGTGTPQDAGDLVEYCNHEGGTYWSDLRKKNGHQKPMAIKTWCVGNEMDGPWQICHLDANDYGKKALETIKIMKWTDDSIKTVVCGSASSAMPTYPEWDRIVLEHTYELADYISIHRYFENFGDDDEFLASFYDMAITLLNHADRVKAACLAQLVNVIAPIFTEPKKGAFKQTIYYPFKDVSLYGRGTALLPVANVQNKNVKKYGEVPAVIFSAVLNEEENEIALFALNTSKTEESETTIDLRSFGKTQMFYRTELCGADLSAKNSLENPNAVCPHDAALVQAQDGVYALPLQKASWNVIRFKIL